MAGWNALTAGDQPANTILRRPSSLPRPQMATQPSGPPTPAPTSTPAPPPAPSWTGFNPANSVVDSGGFPQVNLGGIYDNARRGLVEASYNNAADAGFGALRAGPYVSSLNQNIGGLQASMAGKAADLAESEAGRRLQQGMQTQSLAAQERMQGAELGSRATLQDAQLAAQKAMLGMNLSSQERLALQQLAEGGRQFNVSMGQRASEFGSNLALQTQQAEDQRLQNYLAFLFGGANTTTQPTGRFMPSGTVTPTTPSPFSTLVGPIMGGAGMAIGAKGMASLLPAFGL